VKRFLLRVTAVLAGVVLGMLIVSGSGPWRELFNRKSDPVPPAPIQRERAPDQRV
jgi:hypothetical protein